jgi:hypothetical protein
MVSLADRVTVPAHVLVRVLDKESVLLNIETERIWSRRDGNTDVTACYRGTQR